MSKREVNLQKAARLKLGLKKGMPKADPGTNPDSKKVQRKLKPEETIGGRTKTAKKKLGYPESYWTDQEKKAQSFTDTSKMNRNPPKHEDEANAIYYDKQAKKRKTIPSKDAKRTDIQISFPSYGD